MLISELKNTRIATGEDLSESDEQKVISSYAKKRKEAIEVAESGGRLELAEKEKSEYDITISYLPRQLDETELKAVVQKHIEEIGLATPELLDLYKTLGWYTIDIARAKTTLSETTVKQLKKLLGPSIG